MDPIQIHPAAITLGFLRVTSWGFTVLALLWIFADDRMRPAADLVLGPNTDVIGGLLAVWPLFAWAAAFALFAVVMAARVEYGPPPPPGMMFGRGMWLSLNAGLFEELLFRCILFIIMPPVLTALNTITFGLIQWLYQTLLIPLADFATLGLLEPHLTGASSWLLAAALLTVNGRFRNSHSYLGWLGWVNSWYVGMTMFYLTFGHGLLAAMVAHALYDAILMLGGTLTSWLRWNDLTSPSMRY
ncbi:hypothetical protein ACIA8K_33465 [Catenuloplanes sp. NPDC051500]|uniref:hypothetical protein n=1 Tax=Catenuloplanes sp. NPDC051500 TaxID=3363959 RepID=UPI00378AD635